MSGWQVKLCDPLVTHSSYLTAETGHNKVLCRCHVAKAGMVHSVSG